MMGIFTSGGTRRLLLGKKLSKNKEYLFYVWPLKRTLIYLFQEAWMVEYVFGQ